MIKVYKIKSLYLGKDLNDETLVGYIEAENDEEVYNWIDEFYMWNEWPQNYNSDEEDEETNIKIKQRIIENKGDFNEEYLGEFYDTKYGWKYVGEITSAVAIKLYSLGMLLERDDK